MAEAISDAGFELHVWARRAESFDAISRVKYLRHDSLKSLAVMVDVLCLCLRDDEDIWNLIRQHRLGAFLAESRIKYLDAPVSGGRGGAVARTLTTLVGGDANDYARCREVFETFSRKVAHMGGVGSGQLTKLLNNAMTMTNLKNAVDVFGLAKNLGIDIRQIGRASCRERVLVAV